MNTDKRLAGVSEADLRAWHHAVTVTWAMYETAERAAKEVDRCWRCVEDAARTSADVARAEAAYRGAQYEARRASERAQAAWARVPTGARMLLRTLPRGSEDLRALMADIIVHMHDRGME